MRSILRTQDQPRLLHRVQDGSSCNRNSRQLRPSHDTDSDSDDDGVYLNPNSPSRHHQYHLSPEGRRQPSSSESTMSSPKPKHKTGINRNTTTRNPDSHRLSHHTNNSKPREPQRHPEGTIKREPKQHQPNHTKQTKIKQGKHSYLPASDNKVNIHHRKSINSKVTGTGTNDKETATDHRQQQQPSHRNCSENKETQHQQITEQRNFWTEPTVLSRLILHGKFEAAQKRLNTHPREACIWMVAQRPSAKSKTSGNEKETTNTIPITNINPSKLPDGKNTKFSQPNNDTEETESNKYSMKQLPLHMACAQLGRWQQRMKDERTQSLNRKNKNEIETESSSEHEIASTDSDEDDDDLGCLIQSLCVTYSAAARFRDHNGRLPLHEALWHICSRRTIAALLLAHPTSLVQLDVYGRSSLDLWEYAAAKAKTNSDKKNNSQYHDVRNLLLKSVAFWQKARAQAELQLEQQNQQQQPQCPPTTVTPAANNDILKTNSNDDYSIVTNDSRLTRSSYRHGRAAPGYVAGSPTSDKANTNHSVPWSQLEQRTLLLEAQLAMALERNFHQQEQIRTLSDDNNGNSNNGNNNTASEHTAEDAPIKRTVEPQGDKSGATVDGDKMHPLELENRRLKALVEQIQQEQVGTCSAKPKTTKKVLVETVLPSTTSSSMDDIKLNESEEDNDDECTLQSGMPRSILVQQTDEEKERLLHENAKLEQDFEALEAQHSLYRQRLQLLEDIVVRNAAATKQHQQQYSHGMMHRRPEPDIGRYSDGVGRQQMNNIYPYGVSPQPPSGSSSPGSSSGNLGSLSNHAQTSPSPLQLHKNSRSDELQRFLQDTMELQKQLMYPSEPVNSASSTSFNERQNPLNHVYRPPPYPLPSIQEIQDLQEASQTPHLSSTPSTDFSSLLQETARMYQNNGLNHSTHSRVTASTSSTSRSGSGANSTPPTVTYTPPTRLAPQVSLDSWKLSAAAAMLEQQSSASFTMASDICDSDLLPSESSHATTTTDFEDEDADHGGTSWNAVLEEAAALYGGGNLTTKSTKVTS